MSTVPQRRSTAHHPRGRRLTTFLTAALALAGSVLLAGPAVAASGSGPDGQQVTVSPSSGLAPGGHTVTVSGSGFDTAKGVYVGLCVDNGPGQTPTPCLGGVDMEGAGGASAWISSNPPAYGEGLATPWTESGGRGSFSVTLSVSASDAFTDCLDPAQAPRGCVIGTRADHTRRADRSADVSVPVTFATGGGSEGAEVPADDAGVAEDAATSADGSLATTGVSAGAAVLLAVLLTGLGALAVLRRRPHASRS